MDYRKVACLDLERMRIEHTINVLRDLDVGKKDRLHVDHVISVLRARIDCIDEILSEEEGA